VSGFHHGIADFAQFGQFELSGDAVDRVKMYFRLILFSQSAQMSLSAGSTLAGLTEKA